MDISTDGPVGPVPAAPLPPPTVTVTDKEAKRLFDAVKPGTRLTLVLLGDLVSERMHWGKIEGRKVRCTAKRGECSACRASGFADSGYGPSHFEHYAPCGVLGKDRKYHQKIVILTDDMRNGREKSDREDAMVGLDELLDGQPARGHVFELARVSKHRFRWTAIKKSPHALANSIPPSFDILPWQRARFGNPQDPTNPPLKIEPFCLTDLAHPTRKVRELEITALDVVPPDEWAKTQAKIREAKERAAAGKLAPPPPQPHEEVQPAPLPDPEKKPGDLAVTEIVSDPRNYGPKVRVAGGVPPISPSGRVGQVPLTATVDEIPVLAAIRNGKHPHPTNGKKGGAA